MQRRQLLGLLGAAFACPAVARAQQGQKPRRLTFVHSGIPADRLTETAGPYWVKRFYQELRRHGLVDGVNLNVDRYSAEGRSERYAPLAAEIVSHNPDVIIANQNSLVNALLQATATIPIVAITGNPLLGGLVASLARPGANLTGVSIDAGEGIVAKRLQILREAIPAATRFASLVADRTEVERSTVVPISKLMPVVNEAELARIYMNMANDKIDGLVVGESGSFIAHRAFMVELAAQHRLPSIYPFRDYTELGGLVSYAPDLGELAVRMANDVHQIFGGAKPGDIPYYQPTKFELVINLKTATAQGIEIPQVLLVQADEVIE